MKHTAGKWDKLEETIDGITSYYINSYETSKEGATTRFTVCHSVELEADAQLIASAPAMIEALKGVLAALTQNKTFHCDIELAKSFAKAAIAKAEGN